MASTDHTASRAAEDTHSAMQRDEYSASQTTAWGMVKIGAVVRLCYVLFALIAHAFLEDFESDDGLLDTLGVFFFFSFFLSFKIPIFPFIVFISFFFIPFFICA